MTHITGWTNRNTPHRRGEPIGADPDFYSDSERNGSHTNENENDDTFGALFYNAAQAAAFKAGG